MKLCACTPRELGRKHTFRTRVPEHDSCASLTQLEKMFPVLINWHTAAAGLNTACVTEHPGMCQFLSLLLCILGLCVCVCVCVCVCFNQLLVFQSVPLFFFGTDDCSYKRYFSVLSSWLASNSQEVKKNLLLFSC